MNGSTVERYIEDKNCSFQRDLKYAETVITLYKMFIDGEMDQYFDVKFNFDDYKAFRNEGNDLVCFNLHDRNDELSDYDCTNNYHYICYTPGTDVSVTASGYGGADFLIPLSECMQMTEELYFQYSTTHPVWQLRLMVLYMVLNQSDCDQFYMDFSGSNIDVLETILQSKGVDYVI